jgi:hypothetical protein
MTKKRSSGRVTPKGTQPSGGTKRTSKATGAEPPRSAPTRFDGTHGRQHVGQPNPTRSGHQRGNR